MTQSEHRRQSAMSAFDPKDATDLARIFSGQAVATAARFFGGGTYLVLGDRTAGPLLPPGLPGILEVS
jgi:hypothetical protein